MGADKPAGTYLGKPLGSWSKIIGSSGYPHNDSVRWTIDGRDTAHQLLGRSPIRVLFRQVPAKGGLTLEFPWDQGLEFKPTPQALHLQ